MFKKILQTLCVEILLKKVVKVKYQKVSTILNTWEVNIGDSAKVLIVDRYLGFFLMFYFI